MPGYVFNIIVKTNRKNVLLKLFFNNLLRCLLWRQKKCKLPYFGRQKCKKCRISAVFGVLFCVKMVFFT